MSLQNLKSVAKVMCVVSGAIAAIEGLYILDVVNDPKPMKILACGLAVVAMLIFGRLSATSATQDS